MNCREKLEACLREAGVAFQIQHHSVAYTAQHVADSERIPSKLVAKVVLVLADSRLAMLVLPAPYRVDFDRVCAALGSKEVRLAREAELVAVFPDCDVGAMPPFGNLYGVPVYVDRSLAEDDTIVFRVGTHTDTMSLKYADFASLAKPTILQFAIRSSSGRPASPAQWLQRDSRYPSEQPFC